MARLLLYPEAISDLDGIWDYTAQKWSNGQAEKYIREIHFTIQNIVSGLIYPKDCSEIKANYLRVKSGHHYIYFYHEGKDICVTRILHEKMHAPFYLPDSI